MKPQPSDREKNQEKGEGASNLLRISLPKSIPVQSLVFCLACLFLYSLLPEGVNCVGGRYSDSTALEISVSSFLVSSRICFWVSNTCLDCLCNSNSLPNFLDLKPHIPSINKKIKKMRNIAETLKNLSLLVSFIYHPIFTGHISCGLGLHYLRRILLQYLGQCTLNP